MRNHHSTRITPVLLPCLLISSGFAAAHLFAPPSASAIMHAFRNALHAPGFAVLTLILFLLLRSRMESRIALVGTAVLCAVTAIAGELLQMATTGDASVADLLQDALGVSSALLLIAFFDNRVVPGRMRKSRYLALVAGLVLMGAALRPAVSIANTLVARAAALPELISFDHNWEHALYSGYGGATISRVPLETDTDLVAVVSMGRANYSGIEIEPFPDWRGYSALRFDIAMPGRGRQRMTLRIDDVTHTGQFADRFNRVYEIDETPMEITIPLSEISALASGRQMRLDSIRSLIFFMIDTDGSEKLIINDIRLTYD